MIRARRIALLAAVSIWPVCAMAQPATTGRAAGAATRPAESPFIVSDSPKSDAPPIRLADSVYLSLVDGFLVLKTSLPPLPSQLRAVEGFTSPAEIMILKRKLAEEFPYAPDQFRLTLTRATGGAAVQLSIMAITDHLDIAQYVVSGENEMSVQFIQRQITTPGSPAVSLIVQSLAPTAGDNRRRYAADNFSAFIRMHPEATTQYVRPMVETIGPQPQLFAVDDNLASCVFPEAFAVSQVQLAEIRNLVGKLDADEFHVRQRATSDLGAMGVVAAAQLGAIDRTKLSPEQSTRIAAILARVRPPYDIDVAVLRSDPGFLLDCLLSRNAAVRDVALHRLAEVSQESIAFEAGPDDAARTKAVYALRQRFAKTLLASTVLAATSPSTRATKSLPPNDRTPLTR